MTRSHVFTVDHEFTETDLITIFSPANLPQLPKGATLLDYTLESSQQNNTADVSSVSAVEDIAEDAVLEYIHLTEDEHLLLALLNHMPIEPLKWLNGQLERLLNNAARNYQDYMNLQVSMFNAAVLCVVYTLDGDIYCESYLLSSKTDFVKNHLVLYWTIVDRSVITPHPTGICPTVFTTYTTPCYEVFKHNTLPHDDSEHEIIHPTVREQLLKHAVIDPRSVPQVRKRIENDADQQGTWCISNAMPPYWFEKFVNSTSDKELIRELFDDELSNDPQIVENIDRQSCDIWGIILLAMIYESCGANLRQAIKKILRDKESKVRSDLSQNTTAYAMSRLYEKGIEHFTQSHTQAVIDITRNSYRYGDRPEGIDHEDASFADIVSAYYEVKLITQTTTRYDAMLSTPSKYDYPLALLKRQQQELSDWLTMTAMNPKSDRMATVVTGQLFSQIMNQYRNGLKCTTLSDVITEHLQRELHMIETDHQCDQYRIETVTDPTEIAKCYANNDRIYSTSAVTHHNNFMRIDNTIDETRCTLTHNGGLFKYGLPDIVFKVYSQDDHIGTFFTRPDARQQLARDSNNALKTRVTKALRCDVFIANRPIGTTLIGQLRDALELNIGNLCSNHLLFQLVDLESTMVDQAMPMSNCTTVTCI